MIDVILYWLENRPEDVVENTKAYPRLIRFLESLAKDGHEEWRGVLLPVLNRTLKKIDRYDKMVKQLFIVTVEDEVDAIYNDSISLKTSFKFLDFDVKELAQYFSAFVSYEPAFYSNQRANLHKFRISFLFEMLLSMER